MATVMRPQAISGVSAGQEAVIESVFPSIAASGLGQLIGRICDSIPVKINGIKVSYLLFAPLLAPFGAIGYLKFKVFDPQYVLTNRTLQIRSSLGNRLIGQVSLGDIDNIAIEVLPGQAFFKAGDLEILNSRGDVILRLAGVPRPERFRQVVLDTCEARSQDDAALKTIMARG